jgi:hypothetical protein
MALERLSTAICRAGAALCAMIGARAVAPIARAMIPLIPKLALAIVTLSPVIEHLCSSPCV